MDIIKNEDRFLHNREITETYIRNFPEKVKDREKTARQISATLSFLKKDNKLTNYTIGNSLKHNFWGFNDWLNSDGNIKPGYMYIAGK
jgi:hypothetical protein